MKITLRQGETGIEQSVNFNCHIWTGLNSTTGENATGGGDDYRPGAKKS